MLTHPQQTTATHAAGHREAAAYDYVIAGVGCAGLSLLMHMISSGDFRHKKIALVDREQKQANDRTWCFWQKEPGLFEDIVYHQWPQLLFYADRFSGPLQIAPYTYKMIRGLDFYRHCFARLAQEPNVDVLYGEVGAVETTGDGALLMVDGQPLRAGWVFNSIWQPPTLTQKQHWLLQHFKGWVIETATDRFLPETATLMDFRIDQSRGTAFCYVMPFSRRKALVEYTLFSPALLEKEAYDEGLRQYIQQQLGIAQYNIVEEEFGVIPMTDYPFSAGEGRVVNIGTAGGQTKGSSGYTFSFIQKHSQRIVAALRKGGSPLLPGSASRFQFYDRVLLHILQHNALPGKDIFADLFRRNKAAQVLKFLDNETSLPEELRIISTLPTLPFTKAAIQTIF